MKVGLIGFIVDLDSRLEDQGYGQAQEDYGEQDIRPRTAFHHRTRFVDAASEPGVSRPRF